MVRQCPRIRTHVLPHIAITLITSWSSNFLRPRDRYFRRVSRPGLLPFVPQLLILSSLSLFIIITNITVDLYLLRSQETETRVKNPWISGFKIRQVLNWGVQSKFIMLKKITKYLSFVKDERWRNPSASGKYRHICLTMTSNLETSRSRSYLTFSWRSLVRVQMRNDYELFSSSHAEPYYKFSEKEHHI